MLLVVVVRGRDYHRVREPGQAPEPVRTQVIPTLRSPSYFVNLGERTTGARDDALLLVTEPRHRGAPSLQ